MRGSTARSLSVPPVVLAVDAIEAAAVATALAESASRATGAGVPVAELLDALVVKADDTVTTPDSGLAEGTPTPLAHRFKRTARRRAGCPCHQPPREFGRRDATLGRPNARSQVAQVTSPPTDSADQRSDRRSIGSSLPALAPVSPIRLPTALRCTCRRGRDRGRRPYRASRPTEPRSPTGS